MPAPEAPATELSVELQGGIATVTFASPSLQRVFQEDLWRTMDTLENNPEVAVVVLTGRRNIFMTGADLGEILALKDRRAAAEYLDLPHSIVTQFCRSRKILIAAINGHCLGGGLELALACDFRLAVDHVRDMEGHSVPFLGFPEARLGLAPALGGAYLATGIVGSSNAKELFLYGEPVTAAHGLKIGLVNAVVSREALIEEARRIAGKMASNSAAAVALTKPLLNLDRSGRSLDCALMNAREAFAECCVSPETIERIRGLRSERLGKFRSAVGAVRG
jgi:enoyl-CoA hydratase/carnithine racemase